MKTVNNPTLIEGGHRQNIPHLFGSGTLFWYQDFSGAGDQNQVFMIKSGI
jgi:hypothetical protein